MDQHRAMLKMEQQIFTAPPCRKYGVPVSKAGKSAGKRPA
jgi:hypothetical protein